MVTVDRVDIYDMFLGKGNEQTFLVLGMNEGKDVCKVV